MAALGQAADQVKLEREYFGPRGFGWQRGASARAGEMERRLLPEAIRRPSPGLRSAGRRGAVLLRPAGGEDPWAQQDCAPTPAIRFSDAS